MRCTIRPSRFRSSGPSVRSRIEQIDERRGTPTPCSVASGPRRQGERHGQAARRAWRGRSPRGLRQLPVRVRPADRSPRQAARAGADRDRRESAVIVSCTGPSHAQRPSRSGRAATSVSRGDRADPLRGRNEVDVATRAGGRLSAPRDAIAPASRRRAERAVACRRARRSRRAPCPNGRPRSRRERRADQLATALGAVPRGRASEAPRPGDRASRRPARSGRRRAATRCPRGAKTIVVATQTERPISAAGLTPSRVAAARRALRRRPWV